MVRGVRNLLHHRVADGIGVQDQAAKRGKIGTSARQHQRRARRQFATRLPSKAAKSVQQKKGTGQAPRRNEHPTLRLTKLSSDKDGKRSALIAEASRFPPSAPSSLSSRSTVFRSFSNEREKVRKKNIKINKAKSNWFWFTANPTFLLLKRNSKPLAPSFVISLPDASKN